jgi:hypothetical protein
MSTASVKTPSPEPSHSVLVQRTVEACELAREAAAIAAEGIATGSMSRLNAIRQCEKELDAIDMEVDSGVTSTITRVPRSRDPATARLHEGNDWAGAHRGFAFEFCHQRTSRGRASRLTGLSRSDPDGDGSGKKCWRMSVSRSPKRMSRKPSTCFAPMLRWTGYAISSSCGILRIPRMLRAMPACKSFS